MSRTPAPPPDADAVEEDLPSFRSERRMVRLVEPTMKTLLEPTPEHVALMESHGRAQDVWSAIEQAICLEMMEQAAASRDRDALLDRLDRERKERARPLTSDERERHTRYLASLRQACERLARRRHRPR